MFFRMIFGLPGAALVTALLFVAMAFMVRQQAPPVSPVETPVFTILAELTTSDPTPRPPKRTEIKSPEPIDIKFDRPTDNPGKTFTFDPQDRTDPRDRTIDLPIGSKPTIRIKPVYPENCRARGAQGVVIVEFDVTAEGSVVNPRIVASANSCLDSTVIRTISKWKYPPQTDSSGRPMPQRGVQESFNFQLTE